MTLQWKSGCGPKGMPSVLRMYLSLDLHYSHVMERKSWERTNQCLRLRLFILSPRTEFGWQNFSSKQLYQMSLFALPTPLWFTGEVREESSWRELAESGQTGHWCWDCRDIRGLETSTLFQSVSPALLLTLSYCVFWRQQYGGEERAK